MFLRCSCCDMHCEIVKLEDWKFIFEEDYIVARSQRNLGATTLIAIDALRSDAREPNAIYF